MRWDLALGVVVAFSAGRAAAQNNVVVPEAYEGLVTSPASELGDPARADLYQLRTLDLDPMDGLSLAGPRAQTGLGFALFLGMAPGPVLAYADGNSRGLGIGYGVGAVVALGMGIWGAIRLRERRAQRMERLGELPPEVALEQRDVRLQGWTVMTIAGALSIAGGLATSAFMTVLFEDASGLLTGVPSLTIGALFMGLGIRRIRERRRLRAQLIPGGIAW